ncbi:MAG TPA: hypothetical protein VHE10_02840 [Candidatus Paceibacterota bacterium]|nr:hypothetical protein [Candidatus Paceibacterota bacterium]
MNEPINKRFDDIWDKVFSGPTKGRRIALVLVGVIATLLVFQAGVSVGYHKASFSYRSSDRFFRMVQGPETGVASLTTGFPVDEFSASHGTAGRIVSVSLPTFVVASPDNREQTVTIDGNTVVRMFRATASSSDIRPEQFTVVLGEPNQAGTIQARFVRIMPATMSVQGVQTIQSFPR